MLSWCALNQFREVRQESWAGALGELNRLFPLHWAEVKSAFPLEMNYSAYRNLEASGSFILVTLREGSALVGYWTCVLSPFLHSRSIRSATTDLVFVQDGHRDCGAFASLHSKMEEVLLRSGVGLWFVGEKVANPIGPALRRLGFTPNEMVYLKRLGE